VRPSGGRRDAPADSTGPAPAGKWKWEPPQPPSGAAPSQRPVALQAKAHHTPPPPGTHSHRRGCSVRCRISVCYLMAMSATRQFTMAWAARPNSAAASGGAHATLHRIIRFGLTIIKFALLTSHSEVDRRTGRPSRRRAGNQCDALHSGSGQARSATEVGCSAKPGFLEP
jgi:hypothetical protein